MHPDPRMPGRYHLMIVGINDYKEGVRPLAGCVRDAHSVADMLLENGVPEEAFSGALFLSPRVDETTKWRTAPPTRQNLLARLDEIVRTAQSGDHVWIYYSGHGAQLPHPDPHSASTIEALIPVDHTAVSSRLLYDFEVGRRLAQLAANQVDSVTVVLDCCHAGGGSRDAGADFQDRKHDLSAAELAAARPIGASDEELRHSARGGSHWEGAQTFIAACHSDELAREDSATGSRQGVFTRTFLELLSECRKGAISLPALRWADIWSELRFRVEQRNRNQRPFYSGPLSRPCLGGTAVPLDRGIAITERPEHANQYELGAGQLLGVQKDSLIGVYERDPPLFWSLGSVQDLGARRGTLRVLQAELTTAVAEEPAGRTIPLGRGARARLLTTHLKLFVSSQAARVFVPADLVATAARRGLSLEIVGDPGASELQLVRLDDGHFALGDSANPPHVTFAGEQPLARFIANIVPDQDEQQALVDGLIHYAGYVTPLRMVRWTEQALQQKDRSVLRPSELEIDLVDCRGLSHEELRALDEDRSERRIIAPQANGHYLLRVASYDDERPGPDHALFALRCRNAEGIPLFVSVFNCNYEGQVEEMALGEPVKPGRAGVLLWWNNEQVRPFDQRLVKPCRRAIERLIVIASTAKGTHGMESLNQRQTLQDCIDKWKNGDARDVAERSTVKSAAGSISSRTRWSARTIPFELELLE